MSRRVVITGMGLVAPLGRDVESFWDQLVEGASGIQPVTRFECADFDVRFGGECRDFDPQPIIPKRDTRRMDRFAQFALVASHEAVTASGLEFDKMDRNRAGVILGSGIGGLKELEDQHNRLRDKGPSKVSAFTIPKLMVNAASGNVSIKHGTLGPSTSVATACASATNAMGDALQLIRHGRVEVVITGGSEAALTPLGLSAFAAMKALSQRNDDPPRASRPFDRDRDGFVMGEGAGVLIFEELEHAKKRGADILAEVVGFGTTADAEHITQPSESGAGAAHAMSLALADASLNPDQIDYINAHGTSTPLGDAAETLAIKTVFGPAAKTVAISSTKSAIGHLLGASGGVELIATIMGLRHSTAPPTINLDHPGADCDLDYVPRTARDLRIDRAMSNSFGFGGHNASIIVARID
ncbi:MAG: beta-ketoacyl-ACP synthase II [Planctomycetes bacterium]|nr:beta-ketoacyl-ACP synthase II [Planctomycetota bacterium]